MKINKLFLLMMLVIVAVPLVMASTMDEATRGTNDIILDSGNETETSGSFRISSIEGLEKSYGPDENISFEIAGIQSNKAPAGHKEGFGITVLIKNLKGNFIYTNQVYTNNSGIYHAENSTWNPRVFAPTQVGKYRMTLVLECFRDEAECASLYGQGATFEKKMIFSVRDDSLKKPKK